MTTNPNSFLLILCWSRLEIQKLAQRRRENFEEDRIFSGKWKIDSMHCEGRHRHTERPEIYVPCFYREVNRIFISLNIHCLMNALFIKCFIHCSWINMHLYCYRNNISFFFFYILQEILDEDNDFTWQQWCAGTGLHQFARVSCAHLFLTLCTMKTLQRCESSHENWQMLQIKTMEAAGRREERRVIRTPMPGTWWVHKDGTS